MQDNNTQIQKHLCPAGLVPKHQKKIPNIKDTKRPLHQTLSAGTGLVAPQPQTQPPVVLSKPPFAPPPPVAVSVPSLDSQLLSSGFDPLAHFMNPHLTQSNTEPNPSITPAGAAAMSGTLNANAPTAQATAETHPFLNQHPIIPSPGVYSAVTQLLCGDLENMINDDELLCFSFLQQFTTLYPSNHQDLATEQRHSLRKFPSLPHPRSLPCLHLLPPSFSPHCHSRSPSLFPVLASLHPHPMESWAPCQHNHPKHCWRTMKSRHPPVLKSRPSVKFTPSCSPSRLDPLHRLFTHSHIHLCRTPLSSCSL